MMFEGKNMTNLNTAVITGQKPGDANTIISNVHTDIDGALNIIEGALDALAKHPLFMRDCSHVGTAFAYLEGAQRNLKTARHCLSNPWEDA